MQPQGAVKQPHGARRRTRLPLSCDPCRTRKLKCNREKPCQNCIARKQETACNFRGPRNGVQHGAPQGDTNAGGAMRERIDHLEDLVKKLISDRQQEPNSTKDMVWTPESPNAGVTIALPVDTPNAGDVAQPENTVMIDGTHSVYRAGDDWHAVLQEINELKRTWSEELDDGESDYNFHPTLSHTVDGSSLLFSQVKPVERIEILSTLPAKPEIDRLISRFFDRATFPIVVPPILHEPTFMREYNEHWRDPSKTNFIWLGLLFSILGITMLAFHQYGEPSEYEGISESLFQLYRIRTAQCLQSGDIAKCLPYTVETLRFNATAELNRKDDNRRGLWIMTGVIVRAAINMGYHRDPSQSPATALQAEYRRRIWLAVISMDDMTSFIGGFPRMMPALHSDTMEPRNLHDWELSEDMTTLPPSRPLAEPTPVTYLIAKGRLFRALGRVVDFSHNPNLGSYETVLDIDREVNDVYQSLPAHMKVVPSGDGHSPAKTMADFSNLSLLAMYHKGICTLHRKFMSREAVDSRFKFSRDRCVSSALEMLAFQKAVAPSFYRVSETRQMLALADMTVFLEMELRRKTPGAQASPDDEVLVRALEESCTYWGEATLVCDEAQRFHQVLVSMLSRVRSGTGSGAGSFQGQGQGQDLDLSVAFPGFSPRFESLNPSISFEDDLINTDFDWATWDAIIDEPATYEAGPLY